MSEPEDWIVRRGDLYLVAPHWILWDDKPSLVCRFTHAQALRWCESYNGSTYAAEDGPPEAVAVYDVPVSTEAKPHG